MTFFFLAPVILWLPCPAFGILLVLFVLESTMISRASHFLMVVEKLPRFQGNAVVRVEF
jgi:hypothetical protein